VLLYLVPRVNDVPGEAPPSEGRRARNAKATRRRILAAAHELFIRDGYSATTVQQIADAADVAWQTVYAVFRTKPAILSALFDVTVVGDDEPVPMLDRPFIKQIAAATDPRDKARIFAAHIRETGSRTAGVVSVLEAAATSDRDIADLWQTLQDQRRYGMGMAVRAFRSEAVLRADVTDERALAVLWFLTGPWPYRALVTESGLSDDDFQRWLEETLFDQLFSTRTG